LRVDKYRLLKTFEATQVSKRFILFHAHFLNSVVKPQGTHARSCLSVLRLLKALPAYHHRRLVVVIVGITLDRSARLGGSTHAGRLPWPASAQSQGPRAGQRAAALDRRFVVSAHPVRCERVRERE
jgi:hypothetical protein